MKIIMKHSYCSLQAQFRNTELIYKHLVSRQSTGKVKFIDTLPMKQHCQLYRRLQKVLNSSIALLFPVRCYKMRIKCV